MQGHLWAPSFQGCSTRKAVLKVGSQREERG